MRKTLPQLMERLREMSCARGQHPQDQDTWEQAADAVEELIRHEQQGGIILACNHPVQCAYPDEGGGCSMCDLTELANARGRALLEKQG